MSKGPKKFRGHARTLQRLKARGVEVLPYAGELTVDGSFDLSWLTAAGKHTFASYTEGMHQEVVGAVDRLRVNPLKHAERFAVPLSIHLVETGIPLNHTCKDVWGAGWTRRSEALDEAAVIVTARIRGELLPD